MLNLHEQLVVSVLFATASAREITFPAVFGLADQQIFGHGGKIDVTVGSAFVGLTTYANLPYVHCLAGKDQQVEKFDIAILGAPFDTVSYSFFCLSQAPCTSDEFYEAKPDVMCLEKER